MQSKKVKRIRKMPDAVSKIPDSSELTVDDSEMPKLSEKGHFTKKSTLTPKTTSKQKEHIKDTDDETDSNITQSEEVNTNIIELLHNHFKRYFPKYFL
jgi:hypothetical protein